MRKRKLQIFDIGDKRLLTFPEAAYYTSLGMKAIRRYSDEIGATVKWGRTARCDRNKLDANLDKRAGKENE